MPWKHGELFIMEYPGTGIKLALRFRRLPSYDVQL